MKQARARIGERSRRWQRRILAACALCAVQAQGEELAAEVFDCLIEPKMTVMVGAPTQGVIDTLEVERTDLVEAGQVVARLKSDVEVAALEHARVRAQMQSEIEAREADLALAELNMRRVEDLVKTQMVPMQERDEAVAQLQVARMAVRQARDNRRLYEQEYARARRVVEQRIIRSPISGAVVEISAFPGEFVYQNPILSVAQIDPLRVEAILPSRLFGIVSSGMQASIEPEIRAGGPLAGVISKVDRVIDAASGTFSVHLELPNPEHRIPGGQRCTLTFPAAG